MRKYVLAIVAVVLASSSAYAQQPTPWANKLFGTETTHDFGVVPKGTQLKHTFRMTNIYAKPLDITELRVSCGCVKAEAAVRTLQPNDTVVLQVSMDANQFVGSKTVRVFVTVGPTFISTATLTVSANARGDVAFSTADLDFGNLQRGQTPTKSIDIEYTGSSSEWRVTEIVKSGSAPFDLKVEELPRQPNGLPRRGYRLLATMKPEPTTGSFKQEIVLKTNDAAAPVLTFNILGNIQAGLSVSPSPILVRDMKVGESQTKKIFVRASRPFRVLGVEGQGDGVTVDVPDRKDTTLVLTVNVTPTKAGDLRKQLRIRTDLNDETTPLIIEGAIDP